MEKLDCLLGLDRFLKGLILISTHFAATLAYCQAVKVRFLVHSLLTDVLHILSIFLHGVPISE